MPTKLISSMPPSIKRPVYTEQVHFLARLITDLIEAYQRPSPEPFRMLPEYQRFVQGAYACGFVCRDIDGPAFGETMTMMSNRPDAIRSGDFRTIRKYIHTMMRAERWNDGGSDFGGGHVYEALNSGALAAVAERLVELEQSLDIE